MPTSAELKATLDQRTSEHDSLLSELAQLREALVEVYDQGGKTVETAANRVAAHNAKLAALEQLLERAEKAYKEQHLAEQTAEYNSLLAKLDPLRRKKDAIIAAQVAAEKVLKNSEYAYGTALSGVQGYLHSGENFESARMSESKILSGFASAQLALDELLSAEATRDRNVSSLIAVYKQRIANGRGIKSLERQAYVLADALGLSFNDQQHLFQQD